MLADLLIIGAMKAGTSILCRQLQRCDGISMARPLRPDFFSRTANWQRGVSWYSSCFSHCPPGTIKTDASTTYARYPKYNHSASRAASVCPDAKIIYLIRNPIDRAISHYKHRWLAREIPRSQSFGQFIREEESAVWFGMYHYQISHYLDYFPRDQILILPSEELFRDPAATQKKINAFLEIDHGYVPSLSKSRVQDQSWVVQSPRGSMNMLKLLPRPLRKFITREDDDRNGARHLPQNFVPRINLKEHRPKLLDAFMPDIEKMSKLVGFDLKVFWAISAKAEADSQKPQL